MLVEAEKEIFSNIVHTSVAIVENHIIFIMIPLSVDTGIQCKSVKHSS